MTSKTFSRSSSKFASTTFAATLLLAHVGPLSSGAALAQTARAPALQTAAASMPPAEVVHQAVEGVIASVKKDSAAKNGDVGQISNLVRQQFVPYTDFEHTTQLAVGKAWRDANANQRRALFEQFQTLIVRTYASELTEITGQDLRFEYQMPSGDGNDVVVRTHLITPSDNDEIDYRLARTPTGWKIYDINILGAWLSTLYKHQFDTSLAQGGVDALITTLTEHNKRDAQ